MNTKTVQAKGRFSRYAFTLIELAVVNISIAGLVGLLLPAVGEARKVARNAASVANLNTLNQFQMTYAAENNGSFYNPWNENWKSTGSVVPQSYDLAGPDETYWRFSGSTRKWDTEIWSFYWYSYATKFAMNDPGAFASPVQFAPSDANMIQGFRNLQLNGRDFSPANYVWSGSYLVSPTLWLKPERYGPGTTGFDDRANYSQNPLSLRRNRIADVTHPANKVVFFERFDFKQNTRIASNHLTGETLGTYKMPPNWNNPRAKPNVALVDGSVRLVDMGPLTAAVGPQGQATNLPLAKELSPCGLFRPAKSDIVPDPADIASGELEYGDTTVGSASAGFYPNFFWTTRNGVKGRDFN